ncbi:MAG: cellulase family glycosylhydrolase [Anaerolineae bacterium]
MLRMIKRLTYLIPLILLLALVLAACDQPVAIVVITATPGGPAEATAEVTAETTAVPTLEPTLTPTVEPTIEMIQVTLPSSIQITPLEPTATWMGPVVGEGYRPPATETPVAPTPAAEVTNGPIGIGTPTTPAPTQTPGPSPTPGQVPVMPNIDPNKVGVQLDINLSQDDWAEAMRMMEQLGVKWLKVQLPWEDMQPNGPDTRNDEFFARVEQYLEDASKRGFNVMVSIVKAPAWARSTQAEDGPPNNPQDLANFVTLVLNEINAGDARPMLGDYIDAVEVWNEPNLLREWQGSLPFNGAGYMQLFGPAYQAVRAYSPTIAVITGGLAPTSNSGNSVDDRDFLRQMFAAGLGNYGDVSIGVHPYSWGNPPDATCCNAVDGQGWDDDPHFFFADTMSEYRGIAANYGRSGMPMWVTELGWASWDGFPGSFPDGSDWMLYNDRWDQGFNTIRALEINQVSPDVVGTILWNLNFGVLAGMIENRDERAAYSMLVKGTACVVDPQDTNRTERPVYWMLHDALHPDITLQDWCGVPPAR